MNSESVVTPPPVSWAQRSARVFLTFNVECEKPYIRMENKLISFKGICAPDKKQHEVVIPLYADIDPDKCTYVNKGRLIEVVLAKTKTDGSYWPTLTNDNKKHHWLKVDFNRWQDENESGDDFDDMNDMFSGKIGGPDDNEKDDSSSGEDEDLPDIE